MTNFKFLISNHQILQSVITGLLGIVGLLTVYYLVVGGLSGDWGYPVEQFVRLQPWMSLVVGGFGVQLGLLSYLRQGGKMMAGTGAGSGLAMAACCAHHVSGELRVAALQKGAGRIKLEIGGKIGREVSFDETG